MLEGLARAFDNAAINGTGTSNQPTGIRNTSGVGVVSMGTPDGGAPTWDKMVEFETTAAALNAPESRSGYMTNTKVRGKLKTVKKDAGSGLFLWETGESATPINGHRALITNAVPSNLVEGASGTTLSSIIYSSDWAQQLIGTWGTVDLTMDVFTLAVNGLIRIVPQMFGDINVRHAEAFVVSDDVITV
jgi:HK97 family phage major capsid protein